MNHLATIQSEFLKEARKWDSMSRQQQKEYLSRHPKSKRKLTGKNKTHEYDVKNHVPASKTHPEFKVGQKVRLKANKEEGWPAEAGVIESIDDIENDVIMVQVDKKYRDDDDDEGLREVGVDQIETDEIKKVSDSYLKADGGYGEQIPNMVHRNWNKTPEQVPYYTAKMNGGYYAMVMKPSGKYQAVAGAFNSKTDAITVMKQYVKKNIDKYKT
jgi:hypothetical protein